MFITPETLYYCVIIILVRCYPFTLNFKFDLRLVPVLSVFGIFIDSFRGWFITNVVFKMFSLYAWNNCDLWDWTLFWST